ncbi:MAG: KpsF/GutQ family sugar-phosphate isomerase [candidate division Zixibacteria bacterium]|nr:KpsF/GutQ family sugar-phosphate isomerase [candidate division Zixibacteria bacterium]
MILETGKEVIRKENDALAAMAERLDDNFTKAVEMILACKGRVIITGLGKSGLIGKKIAATLSSTGTASFFLHAAEGVHGDLGLVRSNDILIAVSKSGATDELHQILPAVKRLGVKTILLTGQVDSPLAARCDIVLDCSVSAEACPNNLVPTSSSTAAMVMGDALAVALLTERHFSPEDFAYLHPGGSLGRRLLMHVEELMHVNSEIPLVKPDTNMRDTILEMTGKRLGCTIVVNGDGRLTGIFTDGDLRRLAQRDERFFERTVGEAMVVDPKTIKPGDILDKALAIMERHSITVLPVVDKDHRPVGIIHLHDILKSKLV